MISVTTARSWSDPGRTSNAIDLKRLYSSSKLNSIKSPRFLPSLKCLFRALLLLGFLLCSPQIGAADTVVFPIPPLPADTNPAVFPAPRNEWFLRFQSNLDQTKGKSYDLLFDGDSITDFWQTRGKAAWDQHYGKLKAVDFGISGDRTENLLWRLQQGQVSGMDPKLIVLMIGTNNIARDSADQIAAGIKAIVGEYLQRCPHSHLLLLGIFPRSPRAKDPVRAKVIAINSEVSALDDGKRVTYLDIGSKFLQPDGTLTSEIMRDFLHPTDKGYEIWADAIQPVVDKYCSASASP